MAFAHQGGAFEGPSSTLFAIGQALDRGATAIELDVHATLDGHLVVCHDETVDRTTDHHGEISSLTLTQLREMDNAHWWIAGAAVSPGHVESAYVHRGKAASDSRFRIATLEEVVSAFPRVLLNLDIKRSQPDVAPYEQLLADEIRRLECTDSVMVASFLDAVIQTFRAMAPRVATSAATGETAAFFFSLQEGSAVVAPEVRALQVPATFGDVVVVDQKFVDAAHELGVAVHVWTINAVDEMVRLLDLGVDGIISDTPTPLATLLDQRGCAWDGRM